MTDTMELEVQKAQLESDPYVEHVGIDKSNGNVKLEIIPTDEFAKQQLKSKDWSEYTVYVEIQ